LRVCLRNIDLSQVLKQIDLKNTTDDALPNYLTSLKFKQSHSLTDVRLSLGYAAVLIAAITFYFDYKLGWDQTKHWTLWAVVVYFFLNGALTFWIWNVEKGIVFVGNFNDTMVDISPTKGPSVFLILW
jgi:signal peptidase complex subunit 2